MQNDSLMSVIDLYKEDLRIYGHKCLPRGFRSSSFHERVDGSLMLLCRQMYKLETLVSGYLLFSLQKLFFVIFQIVTERISTATVLLMIRTALNLKNLYVRRNAVIKRCDWPQSPEWSDDFYQWLKLNSKSYDFVEKQVSDILGYKWHMLSDKEFKILNVNLYN